MRRKKGGREKRSLLSSKGVATTKTDLRRWLLISLSLTLKKMDGRTEFVKGSSEKTSLRSILTSKPRSAIETER